MFTNHKNNSHLEEDQNVDLEFILGTLDPSEQRELLKELDKEIFNTEKKEKHMQKYLKIANEIEKEQLDKDQLEFLIKKLVEKLPFDSSFFNLVFFKKNDLSKILSKIDELKEGYVLGIRKNLYQSFYEIPNELVEKIHKRHVVYVEGTVDTTIGEHNGWIGILSYKGNVVTETKIPEEIRLGFSNDMLLINKELLCSSCHYFSEIFDPYEME